MGGQRAGGLEGIRRRNLGDVLRLVHIEGAQPRSAITATTGLNRSTVADLVSALVAAGLVIERDPDPTRRVGRPSPVAAPHPDVVAIAANPEVDALEIAAIGLDGAFRAFRRVEHQASPSPDEVTGVLSDVLGGWRAGELRDARIAGIGIAVPGIVRRDDGVVRLAPHLGWHDADLGGLVAGATGLPVTVGNDASLAIAAEHRYGAARGIADVLYLNGGASGIGGGIICDGTQVLGAAGYAGEWGQNRPRIAAVVDQVSPDGVLEDEVSRSRLLAAVGLPTADDPTLHEALRQAGQPQVDAEIARQQRVLAVTLGNAMNTLNPAVIVLGGYLSMVFEADPDSFTADVASSALAAPMEGVVIRSAALAERRVLVGAAEAALAGLLADPLGGALTRGSD